MTFGFPKGVSRWQFAKDLYYEIGEDQVFNGAAALAYYFFLAIFPAIIFLLSLLPYLPIHNLHQVIIDSIAQVLPPAAANSLEGAVNDVLLNKRSGLLSFGAVLTLWAASSGLYAIMQQLNVTYDVNEMRPYWRVRGLAILLTLFFTVLIATGFTLIVGGGVLETWLTSEIGVGAVLLIVFNLFRWLVISGLLASGFAITYYFGPDVEQKFKFISPGSFIAVIVMATATVAFRMYVEHFNNYTASYGSIGAVIILMLWLYIVGLVLIVGSEINALIEHYAPEGKNKGERKASSGSFANSRGSKTWVHPKGRAPLPGRGLEISRADRMQPDLIITGSSISQDVKHPEKTVPGAFRRWFFPMLAALFGVLLLFRRKRVAVADEPQTTKA